MNRPARRPRTRHQRFEDEDEPEDDEESSSNWKFLVIIGVIIACFAVLYPKMFHPLIMNLLGYGYQSEEPVNPMPFGGPGGARHGDAYVPPNGPGGSLPHPGMRMAAHMAGGRGGSAGPGVGDAAKTATTGAQTSSSLFGGKGFTSMMLPVYSVGVIAFLLYTLSKIMFKKSPKLPRQTARYNLHYNTESDRFEVDDPMLRERSARYANAENDESDELSDAEQFDPTDSARADGIEARQLKHLHSRLSDTERAMQKILQQLESLGRQGQNVDEQTAQTVKALTKETLTSLSRFEAASAVSPVQQQGEQSEQQPVYIQDLERALLDFKKFSDDYVEKASKEQLRAYRESKMQKQLPGSSDAAPAAALASSVRQKPTAMPEKRRFVIGGGGGREKQRYDSSSSSSVGEEGTASSEESDDADRGTQRSEQAKSASIAAKQESGTKVSHASSSSTSVSDSSEGSSSSSSVNQNQRKAPPTGDTSAITSQKPPEHGVYENLEMNDDSVKEPDVAEFDINREMHELTLPLGEGRLFVCDDAVAGQPSTSAAVGLSGKVGGRDRVRVMAAEAESGELNDEDIGAPVVLENVENLAEELSSKEVQQTSTRQRKRNRNRKT